MADLDGPPMPESCAHLWRWFLELSAARGSNGWGPNAINYGDILAWSRLTRTIIRPVEVRVILHLDHIYLANTAKAETPPRPLPGSDPARQGRRNGAQGKLRNSSL
jgi:hypothetical protein